GKPVGFKLCVGRRSDFLAVCKAMRATGITPDFIIVDGSEGGTGAAPLEFEDHMGMPLTDALTFVHNALIGTRLREHIRIGASGKVASGADIVKRLIQGADYTNSARGMMMALGCIQSQRCHTNNCPVGVTTQDPKRTRALVVADKAERVRRFQQETIRSANALIAALGVTDPADLVPNMLVRRTDDQHLQRFRQIHHHLEPGQLLDDPPQWWAAPWRQAVADRFT
ncbi:MAG: glutamate synthase-related protein, partial [Stackebrandtia sp.]